MRVIVCGGRDFGDEGDLWNRLEIVHRSEGPITALAQGGAKGADSMALQWAKDEGIPHQTFVADWKTHGKAAGPLRNMEMLQKFNPDAVIAFAGGKGTSNMVFLAKTMGVRVIDLRK